MRPEGVVLPTPAISQGLGLGHGREQMGLKEFILDPGVERFRKPFLPRGSGLDVRRLVLLLFTQLLRAWAMNSGPLSLRMNGGLG